MVEIVSEALLATFTLPHTIAAPWKLESKFGVYENNNSIVFSTEGIKRTNPSGLVDFNFPLSGYIRLDGLNVDREETATPLDVYGQPVMITIKRAGRVRLYNLDNTSFFDIGHLWLAPEHYLYIVSAGTGISGVPYNFVAVSASGYLGLGIATPLSRLHVYNPTGGRGVRVEFTDTTSYESYSFYESNVLKAAIQSIGTAFATTDRRNALEIVNIYTGGKILFYTGGAERLRILSTGEVGVGTTSPGATLEVNGYVKIGNGAASCGARLMVNTSNGTAAGIQLFQDSQESWITECIASGTSLRWLQSGNEKMRLTNGGFLGINSSNPLYRLVVHEGSSTTFIPMALTSSVIGTVGATIALQYGYAGNTYQKGALIYESLDANGVGKFHVCLNNEANSNNATLSNYVLTVSPTVRGIGVDCASPRGKIEVSGTLTGADYAFGGLFLPSCIAPTQSAYGMYFFPTLANSTTNRSLYAFYINAGLSTTAGKTVDSVIGLYMDALQKLDQAQ
jgi:hypothetical protein